MGYQSTPTATSGFLFVISFMRCFLVLLILSFILTSCERTVTFDLDDVEDKLVVDASIENGQAPVVILTKSLKYFSLITPEILASSFIRNADVYVSNGSSTHKLREYSIM